MRLDRSGRSRPTPTPTRDPAGQPDADAVRDPPPVIAHRRPPICTGDCQGDGAVEIADLITGVNIALGTRRSTSCLGSTATPTAASRIRS